MPQKTSVTAAADSSFKNTQAVPVNFTYTVTKSTGGTVGTLGQTRRKLANTGYVGYTSTAAPISISLNVTPVGGSTSNYTGSCSAASSGTSGTCTVTGFTAAPGPTTIAGTITEAGNTIATFSNLTIIQPSTVNNINFTANPVVNSVVLSLASASVNAGLATDDLLTVQAKDANGNIIAGTTNYVDANGTPVSLTLSVKNAQAGGRGSVYIKGPSRITAPGQTAIYAHYDGNWLDYSTISVATTSSAIPNGNLTAATLTTIPYATEYTATGGPHGITAGPDGNIWFTENSASAVGKMTISGTPTNYGTGVGNPVKILPDGRGNLLVSYSSGSKSFHSVTTGGVPTTLATLTQSNDYGIAIGPDGNFWIAEGGGIAGNIIARVTPTGKLTEFTTGITVGSAPNGIALGPDGNLWFTEFSSSKIGRITVTGNVTEFSAGITGGANLQSIVAGPDGNLWFTELFQDKVGKMTPSGFATEYSTGITGGGHPRNIIVGPDGNLWFCEDDGGRIARITTAGVVTEYSAGMSGGRILDLTLGPDGNIWYSGYTANTIGKFVF